MGKLQAALKRKHLLVLIPLVVYLTSLSQYWICSDDSALYIYQARSFLQTGTFMQNGEPFLAASPGFPAMLAGIMGVAGESNFFVMQLCMVLMGLGVVLIIRRQRWIWSSRFEMRWVLFATVMSYYFHHNISRILTEAPSLVLFWAIISLLRAAKTSKWFLLLVGLGGYVAVFTRTPAAVPIAAIGVATLFERRLVSGKFRWRFLGSAILALGVIAAMLHTRAIANAYQQAAPYAPSSGELSAVTDTWFAVVDGIGRLVSNLMVAQSNWVVGWVALVLMGLGAWRCYRHRNRKLVFPAVFMIVYAPLLIAVAASLSSNGGSWAMIPRYWFYALPFVIYYLIKGFELLGAWLTRAIQRPRPYWPLPKFAAAMICIVLLVQLPRIAKNNLAAMYGWGHSPQQFYEKFNKGRNADIMSLASQLAREQSTNRWIAASERISTLRAFSGRYVHDLRKGLGADSSPAEPLEASYPKQWSQHPPEVVLLRRPSGADASEKRVYSQLMGVFSADKENWALDEQRGRWSVFRRKPAVAEPTQR